MQRAIERSFSAICQFYRLRELALLILPSLYPDPMIGDDPHEAVSGFPCDRSLESCSWAIGLMTELGSGKEFQEIELTYVVQCKPLGLQKPANRPLELQA